MLRRRPLLVDTAIAAAFVLVAELEVVFGLTTREPWLHAVSAPLFLAPLAVRRRWPLAVLALAIGGLLTLDPQANLSFFGAQVIASYTVGSKLDPPRVYLGPLVALVPFIVLIVLRDGTPSDLVAYGIFYVGPWFVGRLVKERVSQALELVRLSERERERETAAAIAGERARIARELHDIVSHAISVVAVQTQAVRRRLPAELEREAEDLRGVETTAREAMAEMRRLFGVLRADGAPAELTPQPGLDQLDRLVEQVRGSGLPLEVTVEGEWVPLPPGVDLAAYRVIQEALTNVVRHAGSAPTRVALRFGASHVEVVVEDDGPGKRPGDSGGHGLLGMRERVTLYGGELVAGSVNGAGFRVRALLPFREAQS